MKLAELIKQLTESVDPEEEITSGEEQNPAAGEGSEEAQSVDDEKPNTEDLQAAVAEYRTMIDEQQKHIEQLTTQISVLVKQGAQITDSVDKEVAEELAKGGNPDLEARAKELESARKGIYALDLTKTKE